MCVPKPTGCAALAADGEAATGDDEEDESLGVEEKDPDLDDKEKGEGRKELFGVAVEDFRVEDDDGGGVGTTAGAVLVFFTSFLLPLLRGRFF